ncbi:hypothetical protein, partial [Leptospira bourretii]
KVWLMNQKCYEKDSVEFKKLNYYIYDTPSYLFVYDYEYMIPIPSGKTEFRFIFQEEKNRFEGYTVVTKEINVLPNHNLILDLSQIHQNMAIQMETNQQFIPCAKHISKEIKEYPNSQ